MEAADPNTTGTPLVTVEYMGSRVLAERDSRGMLVCPICGARFASGADLMHHIVSHAKGYTSQRRRTPSRWSS